MVCGCGGSSLPLSMLSLVGGMYLIMKSCSTEVCCRAFAKIVGWVIVIISIIMVVSGIYWKVTMCKEHGWCMGKGRGMMMMHHKGMKGMPPPMPGEKDMGED